MQIIESTHWGVRSARLTMRHPASGKQVVLFPMIHVGELPFYKAVYDDAFSQDAVLVEGIRSPVVARITRSYRWIGGSRRLNLAIQPPYPHEAIGKAAVIHADLSAAEFDKCWRRVPLWLRLLVYASAPAHGLWFRWFGSRKKLAAGLALDDAASQHELLSWGPETGFLDRAMLDARDKALIGKLNQQLATDKPTMSVAIVYGATHMRAVLRDLVRQGYACVDADWMTVFSLDQ